MRRYRRNLTRRTGMRQTPDFLGFVSKPFLVTYSDGSRAHVSRETRDALLASLSIRESGHRRYRYIGKPIIMHTFAELSRIEPLPEHVRRFAEGQFVFKLRGRLTKELMETVEGMTIRMAKEGLIA